ncbi:MULTISPECIES: hypothetical protein [unclassified Agrococcus]|uniref:hypothetical protein n=1 Tax=unclassified Agrococcus TaxID=2615065 RepID=UPI00360B92D9
MRRAWFDPRLAIGAALVVVSIVGVWLVIQAADRSTPVWVASETLLPGDVVGAGDVELVELRMEGAADAYLVGDAAPEGLVVVSPVGAGEALPLSALGDAASLDLATVVVALDGGLPSSVDEGSVVDVWAAPLGEEGAFEAATVLVGDAVVVGLVEDEGIIADDAVRLEVLVPRADVADVLDATAAGHALSVVPVAAPVTP